MIKIYTSVLARMITGKIGIAFVAAFLLPTLVTAQFQINFPVSRIVFQRNNANQAMVPFSAIPTAAVTQLKVRLVVRQGGVTTGWTTLTPTNGVISGSVPAVQGGWYDLEAEAFNGSISLGIKRVQRVGVGEVLLVSGQSNAQGFSSTIGAADDRVSCVDFYSNDIREFRMPLVFSQLSNTARVGPTNALYIYGMLGDKLVQRLGVPVLLYGAAWGGTSSSQWRQSAEGNLTIPESAQWGGADELMPYRAIRATLNHYVQRTGLRGIFWHQGESDKGLSGTAYVSNLKKVIEISRQDVGSSTLAWIVSRASWLDGWGDNNIIQAQNQVIAEMPYCYPGPNTDVYDNSYRRDQTHFLESFYPQLAQIWNDALTDTFFQQSTPYVLSTEPPRITVGMPQPAYQYTNGHLVIPFMDESTVRNKLPTVYTAQLVSLTGQFITNLGSSTSSPMRVTLPGNSTGTYRVRVVSSINGAVSSLSPPISIFTPTYAMGTGSGLIGEYISGIEPNGPVLHTQLDGPLDLTWFRADNGGPTPFMPIRDYVVRWTGQVEAPVTGTYTIKAANDDGSRIWINDQLIVDDWASHPWANTKKGQVTLQANQRYNIKIELLQRWFDAQVRLQWVVPGTSNAVYIPKDRLYPALLPYIPEAEPMEVVFPRQRTVFQRSVNNVAQVTIAGTCPTRTERIEIRVSPTIDSYGQNSDAFVLLDNQPANGFFSGKINITGGWYNLDVRAIAQNQVICHTRVTPVGVGEVFVIAGEANAQGVTPIRSVAAAMDTRVNCVPHYNYTDTTRLPVPPLFNWIADGETAIGPHGNTAWCWSELGDILTKRLNVPVLFYNTAWAGTTVRNWRESMEQGNTTIGGNALPAGMPYSNLKRVLQDYVPLTGLRAVLWQQGETEYYSANPQATNYAADLQAIIARTRLDSRSAELPWLVARASADNTTSQLYPSGSYEPVTNQQNNVIQTVAKVMAGPIVDTIQMPRPDGKHLQGAGLSRLAAAWNNALTTTVWNTSPVLSMTPVVSDLRLSAQVTNRVQSVGTDFQTSVTVWNEGPVAVSNAVVRCLLPNNLQFVNSTSMTYQAGNLLAIIANIAARGSATLSFTARMQQPGAYRMAAEIVRVDQLDLDSRPNTSIGNGEDDVAWIDFRTLENSSDFFTVMPSPNAPLLPVVSSGQPLPDPNKVDLSLRLVSNSLIVTASNPVSVSLIVTNTGAQPAQNVQIGCSLPAGLTFSSSANMSLSGNTVRGTIPSIPAGGQGLLHFTITPNGTGNWNLQAQIEATSPTDADSTPNNGFANGEDDVATLNLQTLQVP
ncbi:sialate O-acetylesterase [Spirosoma sp.]|uniref:sialate O-acetylesterase n=1 Tax=Spirosoma sp. TaxID=1899569 RepID=UPI003B3B6447